MTNNLNSSLLSSLEYNLRCGVCFEEYSEEHPPVTLRCGHNLCKLCVKRLKKRRYYVKCPMDNTVRRINENSVNQEFLGNILLFKEILDENSTALPQKRSVAVQCSDQHYQLKEKVRRTQSIVQSLETNLSYLYYQFNALIARSYFWFYFYDPSYYISTYFKPDN